MEYKLLTIWNTSYEIGRVWNFKGKPRFIQWCLFPGLRVVILRAEEMRFIWECNDEHASLILFNGFMTAHAL